MLVGTVFTPWAIVWGAVPTVMAMIGWFWPKPGETREHVALEKKP
jgi:cytochrome c oxidase subunit 1